MCDPNTCNCGVGYDGLNCTECGSNYYKTSNGECLRCPSCNSGTCNRNGGGCICPPNYSGARCEQCASGYYNDFPACTVIPSKNCLILIF